MKYYIGENMRDALNNNPIEIKTTKELRRYIKTYNVVLSEKEANSTRKKINLKKPATYEGCIVHPKALASRKPTSRSTTGFRGVYITGGYNQYKGRYYQARITVHENGKAREKVVYCGTNLREAIIARLRAEEEYYEKALETTKEEKKS